MMAMILGAAGPAAFAQNGSWSADADGNWSDSTKWSGATVADGVDFTASFTNDITAPRTVTLDTPRTIGNLTFSDNGANGSPWVLAGPNTLTLDVTSGKPTITATTDTTISTILAGSDGLTKAGSGTLFLANTANTYTGVTTGSAGIVNVASLADGSVASSIGMSSSAAGNLILAGGGTLQYTGSTPQSTNRLFTVGIGAGPRYFSWAGGAIFLITTMVEIECRSSQV